MYNGISYSPLRGEGPMGQPAYMTGTALAPQAPYVGGELAQLTSMTPFMRGNYDPVVMTRTVSPEEAYAYGGWWEDFKAKRQAKKAPPDAGGVIVQLGLKKGDRGPAVTTLQQAITSLSGQPLVADGIFGSDTEAALKAYQSVNGLPETGYVDAATKAHMADPSGIAADYAAKEMSKIQTRAAAGAAVADILKAAFIPQTAAPTGQYVIEKKDTTPWGLIAVGGLLTVAVIGGLIVATRD